MDENAVGYSEDDKDQSRIGDGIRKGMMTASLRAANAFCARSINFSERNKDLARTSSGQWSAGIAFTHWPGLSHT
jgi:hypothetical protein